MDLTQISLEAQRHLAALQSQNWYLNLYSAQWWFLAFLFFGSWIVWWILVDKQRLPEILLFGLLSIFMFTNINEYGTETTLWWYPIKFLPVFTRLIVVGIAVLPVTFMLIYQYCRDWKSYIKWLTVASGFFAFVAQPGLKWMGIYLPLNWPYTYAFLSLIAMGLFTRWLQVKIWGFEKGLVPAEGSAVRDRISPAVSKPLFKGSDDKKKQ